jgi:hypothetical protein
MRDAAHPVRTCTSTHTAQRSSSESSPSTTHPLSTAAPEPAAPSATPAWHCTRLSCSSHGPPRTSTCHALRAVSATGAAGRRRARERGWRGWLGGRGGAGARGRGGHRGAEVVAAVVRVAAVHAAQRAAGARAEDEAALERRVAVRVALPRRLLECSRALLRRGVEEQHGGDLGRLPALGTARAPASAVKARSLLQRQARGGGGGGKTPVLPEYLEVSDTGHHSLLVDVMAAPHHAHDPDGRLWQPCVFHPAHQAQAPAGAGAQTRPGPQGGANLRHPLRSAGMRRRAGRQPQRLVELPRGGEPGSRARLGVSEGPAVATGVSAAAKKAPATRPSRAGTREAGPTACRPAS